MKKFLVAFLFSAVVFGVFTIPTSVDASFVYTRTPTGNPVAPPITMRVQGVFGIDFCDNIVIYTIFFIKITYLH